MLLPILKIIVVKALVALPCFWDWRDGWETDMQVGKCFDPLVKISSVVQVQLRWPQQRVGKFLLTKLLRNFGSHSLLI